MEKYLSKEHKQPIMQRKLIKQGDGALTVTLPKKWTKEKNLEAHDIVDIDETEDGIVISAVGKKKEKTITVDVSEYNTRMIMNIIYQSYRLGFDTISLSFAHEEQYEAIQEVTKTLIGFEVVEKNKNKCTLQNIAEPDETKFEVMLRKIFLQIIQLSEDIVNNFDKNILKQINETKLQVDKLTNYARRAVIRSNKSSLLYEIIAKLSVISHGYVYLYQYSVNKKLKKLGIIIEHISEANKLMRTYYDAFYKKDFKLLYEIGVTKTKLFQKNDELLEKGKDAVVLSYIREIIRNVQLNATVTIGYLLPSY